MFSFKSTVTKYLWNSGFPKHQPVNSFLSLSVASSKASFFFTECDLVPSLSISSIISFPQVLPVVAYVFFIVFASLLSLPSIFPSVRCFRRQFVNTDDYVSYFLMKLGFQQINAAIVFVCASSTEVDLWTVTVIK
jgi:hypothetical protein